MYNENKGKKKNYKSKKKKKTRKQRGGAALNIYNNSDKNELFDVGKMHWAVKFAYDCLLEAGVDEATALKTIQGVKEAKKVPVSKPVSKDPFIAKMQETKAKYIAIRKKYGKEWKDSKECIKELKDAGWKAPKRIK